MKRKIEYGIIIIIVVLVALLALKLRLSYKKLQNDIKSLSYDVTDIKAKNTELNNIYLNSINVIPKDILIELAYRRKEKTIIGFFNKENCGYCVKEVIIELEKFASKYGFYNINLISNVEKEEDFFEPFGGMKQDDFPYTYIKNSKTLSEMYGLNPTILVVNSYGEILHIYIPELQREYNEVYFNQILPNILFGKNDF